MASKPRGRAVAVTLGIAMAALGRHLALTVAGQTLYATTHGRAHAEREEYHDSVP